MVRPSGPTAAYPNLFMSAPRDVDRAEDLGECGDAVGDKAGRLLLQRPHAFLACGPADLVVPGPGQDEFADGLGDRHHLVDPGPVEVSGLGAEVAPGAAHEAALQWRAPD